ncbi:hypothetical protein ERX35_005675 [Macrococcus equipercicus]|uniref:Membrane-anchored protein n=1 Tax=Macrococcus equipercicus TaxID=69967 RepID=A0ABQ6R8T7_9STAP|nr:hypothetical protein [Macrococcus equipercicus]KAA1039564.1 hypothetical protein ERX35_005675 [Macrococcus equipercicus]
MQESQNKPVELLNKVPQITLFFWLIKILCTTVGETFADFINFNIGLGLTVTTIIMGIALGIALFFQFRVDRYKPFLYWISVVLLSMFGTLVTDNLTDNMGVPLELSTVIFSLSLALTFLFWYKSEKTLSIHSVFTRKREAFYWLTILFTFALGTAVGDLYSEQLGFGYLYTGIGVVIIIALVYLAYQYMNLNSILAFWVAYILTRPLGASLGDLLSQSRANGGFGFGTTVTSVIFLVAILAIIIYLAITKIDYVDHTVTSTTVNGTNRIAVLMQTIAVLLVFLIGGLGIYQWRMNSIAPSSATLSGKLNKFITIEKSIKQAAAHKDYTAAKTNADQLEHDWDADEPKLRAIDNKQWTQVDGTIDSVLAAVRASNPDTAKINNAVTQSQSTINQVNK